MRVDEQNALRCGMMELLGQGKRGMCDKQQLPPVRFVRFLLYFF
jgi:hypothetical protein